MSIFSRTIRVGTRKSSLALKQTELFIAEITKAFPDIPVEICTFTTSGDRFLETSLADKGGKGLFIKEIEEALLDNSIDVAVHSMKDMPAFITDSLDIPCIMQRESAFDAFISPKAANLHDLPPNAVIGSASTRRAAQALAIRPDLKITLLRGSVATRLKKVKDGQVDATFLAAAGLNRLGLTADIRHIFTADEMLPAVAQGAIGIECRKNDTEIQEILSCINHQESFDRVLAERAFMQGVEGDCSTPLAAYATISSGEINLSCLLASENGNKIIKTSRNGPIDDAINMGNDAAAEILLRIKE